MHLPEYTLKHFFKAKNGTLIQEASTLGLPPGALTWVVIVEGVTYKYLKTDQDDEGEVHGWRYKNQAGQELLIIND